MINANEIWETVRAVANKSQSGSITPDEFNRFWRMAETNLLNELDFSGTRYGTDGYSGNKRLSEELSFAKTEATLTPINHKATLPSDYLAWDAISLYKAKDQFQEVDILERDEFANRSKSKLLPTSKYPIAKIDDDQVFIIPNERFKIEYLRYPVTPMWAYTLDSNNRPVYDPINSVDSEFPARLINDVVFKICSLIGINMSKAELVQYAEMK